jgi:hypothetical protein
MAAASSGSVATESTGGITGRVARRASKAFKYRPQSSQAKMRYCPSRLANDFTRAAAALRQ